jgi:hypothetical protein
MLTTPQIRSLVSPALRLDFLSTAGPRIVGLYLIGSSENLLAETPEVSWDTPYGEYHLIGGHRLWIAPESPQYTSIPDDHGLGITGLDETSAGGIRLTQPPDAATHVSRSIDILLDPARPVITLTHRLTNLGSQPFTGAAWAITQLPLGGVALLPFSNEKVDENGLQPNRSLVIWPYTHWEDARLQVSDLGCTLRGSPESTPCKIGSFNRPGWLGYYWKEFFFVKLFTPQENVFYTDLMCNAELFVQDRFLELESLSPLATLEPGGTITHVETWHIYRLPDPVDPSAAPKSLFSLAAQYLPPAA